jgi:signal transduction histidine kinase
MQTTPPVPVRDGADGDPTAAVAAMAPWLAAGAALAAAAIGAVVLVGWAADVDAMRRLFFGRIHMLPNTAVGFLLASVSLWLQRAGPAEGRARAVARTFAVVVLLLGALTMGERLFGWDLGIDRRLFPELVARHPYRPPGQMATNTTVAFTLAGAALLWLDVVTERGYRPALWLATVGLAIASLALVGYLYGAQPLYEIDVAAGMAISTALAFLAIHVGVHCARPSPAGLGLMAGRGASGALARRMLLAVVLVPPALGWLWIRARQGEVVGREVGVAIFVVAVIAILLTVALRATAAEQGAERAREAVLAREAEARREAERASRAKDDFLAVMSHELRTPLNAIIGYGSLLGDGIPEPLTAPQRRQVERITASARHLLALIDEVLTLSRTEIGEDTLTPASVGAASVVEEAAAMVEPAARAKGLRFDVLLPEGEGALTVETDASKLRQALVNLLGNAVKFTDRGEVRLHVVAEPGGGSIAFVVEDTGVGIAAEHLGRVFDAFWQVDQARSRRVGGVGLGLHVTRRLARLLGGDVTVQSVVGEGSRFTLRLPRRWWGAGSTGPVVVPPREAVVPRAAASRAGTTAAS